MADKGRYPKAVRLDITTGEFSSRAGMPVLAIVEHVSDGTNSINHGQNVANNSSFHFLIRIENGRAVVYQFMSVEVAAWANGRYSDDNLYMPDWLEREIARGTNPNRFTVSVEHEREWPYSTAWPDAQIEASIELNKWLIENYPTIKPDRDHIIGHYQIDNVQRPFCPGGPGGRLFPFERIVAALQPTPDPIERRVMNGFEVAGGFLRFWDTQGGLEIFGLPIEGVVQGQVGDWSGPVQWFERARFEDHDGIVLLGRVGVEAKAAIP